MSRSSGSPSYLKGYLSYEKETAVGHQMLLTFVVHNRLGHF